MLSAAFDAMGAVGVQSGVPTMPGSASGMSTGAPFDQGTDTLWVFLLELLSAPQSYGHVICWTDYSQAEFKLYKPAEVATLWGRRKNRPAMNYDKLSRSLRYYYKKNILRKVPGRKYVYQFCRLDQLLASLNPLNSPIATAYCQIFSQHLAANFYNQPQQGSSLPGSFLPMPHGATQPMMSHLRQSHSLPLYNAPTLMAPSCSQMLTSAARDSNTPVSFKTDVRRPAASKNQPLTPSDDEGADSCDDDGNDIDVEDHNAVCDRFDGNNPAFHVSPQTAFASYAAIDGNSQPESIIHRNQTPPISQITPSASGSEGRTPSIFSSAGEPPAKQEKLSTSSSSPVTSSPAPVRVSAEPPHQLPQSLPPPQPTSSLHNIAERRSLKRKPEPLKFAFSAANLATSSVLPAATSNAESDKLQQQYAFLNTLNNLQAAISPFTARTFNLFNPMSAALATPQTTDWLKMLSPRPEAPAAQPVSSFTFPPPLAQFAPLGIPAPLPSPMMTTPLLDSAGLASAFTFPSMMPQSANMQSLFAASHLASNFSNGLSGSTSSTTSSTSSSLKFTSDGSSQ